MKEIWAMPPLYMVIWIKRSEHKVGTTLLHWLWSKTLPGLCLQILMTWYVTARKRESHNDQSDLLMTSDNSCQNDLYDLQHSGNCLSWRGKRKGHNVIFRLDRSFSNSSWTELYPSERCEYLCFESYDHRPLETFSEPLRKEKRNLQIWSMS